MVESVLLAVGVEAATAATIGTAVSGLGTLLSVGTGIAGAISSSNQSAAQAELARLAAQSGTITAEMEILRGQQEANRIRENMLKTLATQRARYAGAGIVLDSGTPATVQEATTEEADRETQIIQTNAGMRAATARIAAANQEARANLLDDQADSLLWGGIGSALSRGLTRTNAIADLLPGRKVGDKLLS